MLPGSTPNSPPPKILHNVVFLTTAEEKHKADLHGAVLSFHFSKVGILLTKQTLCHSYLFQKEDCSYSCSRSSLMFIHTEQAWRDLSKTEYGGYAYAVS